MKHALLVDDKEENLAYLSALLKGHGFGIELARNGAEALVKARQTPPDIIISDLLMPVMDGYTLLRHWKSDPRLAQIPFIVYTATYTGPGDESLALKLGADAVILKPAEPEDFMIRLRQVLAKPASGIPASPIQAAGVENMLLKEYSETLVRKLEDKCIELEETNRELQRETIRLEASQKQYLLLLNSTAEGIYGLDVSGLCTFCNLAAARLLGYQHPDESVGISVHQQHHHRHDDGALYPISECKIHQALRSGEQGTHADDEVFFRVDGAQFPVEYWSYPIHNDSEVVGAVVTFLDITERRNLEAQVLQAQAMEAASLKNALAEKTVLLEELEHRVKNNLAVISGLLGMQANALDDERVLFALAQSRQRIHSMALVHEYLYAADRLDRVNFGQYMHKLANELRVSYAAISDLVDIEIKTEQIELPVHSAIPCGLILNELLSNVLKYAFPDGRRGNVEVHFGRLESGELLLSCRDDGVGIPESFDWQNSDSPGLKICNILAKQLDGRLTLDRGGGGARFELRFPSRGL